MHQTVNSLHRYFMLWHSSSIEFVNFDDVDLTAK